MTRLTRLPVGQALPCSGAPLGLCRVRTARYERLQVWPASRCKAMSRAIPHTRRTASGRGAAWRHISPMAQLRHRSQIPHSSKPPIFRPSSQEQVVLGSPQGGLTLESGAWGEHSNESSTDGAESGLQDFLANLVAHRSSSGVRLRWEQVARSCSQTHVGRDRILNSIFALPCGSISMLIHLS